MPPRGLSFGLRLDPVPLQVAGDALEPGPDAVHIGFLRADMHHRDRLGIAEERQRVMERPVGLARSVPGDEHPSANAREGAGIGDDDRPSGGGDDMIRPEPGHAVRVIARIFPEDRQIGRLGELGQFCQIGVIDDVSFAVEPAWLQHLAEALLDGVGLLGFA
jgi:hypothetical protein